MKIIKKTEIIVCDKCGKELRNWEDFICAGELSLYHSSVITDVFSGNKDNSSDKYFNSHPAVRMGKHAYQSMILQYGGDNKYHLCWGCNREFIELLGKFFTYNQEEKDVVLRPSDNIWE